MTNSQGVSGLQASLFGNLYILIGSSRNSVLCFMDYEENEKKNELNWTGNCDYSAWKIWAICRIACMQMNPLSHYLYACPVCK